MRAALAIAAALMLAACTPSPEAIEPADAQKLVDAMQFVRHQNGLCFGVVVTSRLSLKGDLAQNVAIAHVDCAKVPQ